MQIRSLISAFFCACGMLAASAWSAPDNALPDIAVQVNKRGELVIVDAEFTAPVAPKLAWEVLTDFNHMSNFISNVKFSSITSQQGSKLQVAQKGAAKHGPLSFNFDSIREIELQPIQKITSHVISGSMKKLDGVTTLRADGTGSRIVYHADSIPDAYVPPVIGPKFIENETRHQFEEMRAEMIRRAATP